MLDHSVEISVALRLAQSGFCVHLLAQNVQLSQKLTSKLHNCVGSVISFGNVLSWSATFGRGG